MKNKFEKYLKSVVDKYIPILFLERYTFEFKDKCENPNSIMECRFNYPYLNATLHYSEKAVKDWEAGKDITPYIVHEMCHIITDPFYAKATSRYVGVEEIRDERELLTDYICNIVIKNKL